MGAAGRTEQFPSYGARARLHERDHQVILDVNAANLAGFYLLLVLTPTAVGEATGRVFYVWMSVFNLFVTMVFWALMADRFTLAQSKRLFGLIAVGGTVGAMFGSAISWTLAERIGTPQLLLLAAGFLALAVGAAWGVTHLTTEARLPRDEKAPVGAESAADRAVIGLAAVFAADRAASAKMESPLASTSGSMVRAGNSFTTSLSAMPAIWRIHLWTWPGLSMTPWYGSGRSTSLVEPTARPPGIPWTIMSLCEMQIAAGKPR